MVPFKSWYAHTGTRFHETHYRCRFRNRCRFRMYGPGRVRVNVQVAKIAAERLVAFHVERLIAKEQDLMLRQRLVQLLDLAVAERLGERQAVDLGANARRNRRDVDGFVAHSVTSRVRGKYISFRGQPPPPQPSRRFLGGLYTSIKDGAVIRLSRAQQEIANQPTKHIYPIMDKLHFDRTDYSVVVKNRAPPPNSWRWEIYRAGRSSPIEQSSVYFHTMATANRAGKEALRQLLDKLKV